MYPKEHFEKPERRMEKLDLLSDPKARKILEECRENSRSIEEVSKKQGIPLNICHRIVTALKEFDLVQEEKVVRKEGKKISFYRTVTKNTFVTLGENEPRIELEFYKDESRLSLA